VRPSALHLNTALDRHFRPTPTGRGHSQAKRAASDKARSWKFEPKMRSTRVPVHLTSPVLRSRPSNKSLAYDIAFHSMPLSSKFTKKSLVRDSGFLVKMSCRVCSKLMFRTHMPPTSTAISGAFQRQQLSHLNQRCLGKSAEKRDDRQEYATQLFRSK